MHPAEHEQHIIAVQAGEDVLRFHNIRSKTPITAGSVEPKGVIAAGIVALYLEGFQQGHSGGKQDGYPALMALA